MGCNCGGNKKTAAQPRTFARQSSGGCGYEILSRDGSVQDFGSRALADAANAEAGYTGIVRPKACA